MSRLSYHSAERFIFSREFFGMKLGLENIFEFLRQIGQPQDKYKTVHIAGTNGKGSTAAMLDAIFRAQGYRTGLYTSPHLVDFRERIQVNGEKIDKPAVISFIAKHKRVLQSRKLTFFEVVTALAFDYFARARVEVAVIETGLGGRLDATNVLSPRLTITTDIDFDHTDVLGTTIGQISREKAGIIKSGRPHLMGVLPKQAMEILSDKCYEMKSPLYRLDNKNFKMHVGRMSLDFKDEGLQLSDVAPALYGAHQLKNTALALKAASIFRQNGLFVSKKAVVKGIRETNWPGRFQVLRHEGRPKLVLDVAHNPGGIRAFVESFKLYFPDRQAQLVTGFVRKKNHQVMFDQLSKIAAGYALVPLRTRRSVDLNELIKTVDFREIPARKFGSLAAAVNYLTKKAGSDDIICVIGSHYLVGEFLEKFGEKWPERADKNQNRRKHQTGTNRPQKRRKAS